MTVNALEAEQPTRSWSMNQELSGVRMLNSPLRPTLLLLFTGMLLAGCGSDGAAPVQSIQRAVQKTVDDTAAAVEEATAAVAGKITLSFPRPLEIEGGYARIIPAGESRPAVLQIFNQKDSTTAKPPIVFFQADLPSQNVEELVGQKVNGRIFVQYDEATLYASSWEQPTQFEITTANQWSVGCTVAELPLIKAGDDKPVLTVEGELIGVLQNLDEPAAGPPVTPTANASAGNEEAPAST